MEQRKVDTRADDSQESVPMVSNEEFNPEVNPAEEAPSDLEIPEDASATE